MPGFTVEETFENKVTEILSKVREDAATVVENTYAKTPRATSWPRPAPGVAL
jgi:hypothetical protein